MSRSLSVRNLDDVLVASLRRRAARQGRFAETAEVREILRQVLSEEAEARFDDSRASGNQGSPTQCRPPRFPPRAFAGAGFARERQG
jgi:plasmid stability protein